MAPPSPPAQPPERTTTDPPAQEPATAVSSLAVTSRPQRPPDPAGQQRTVAALFLGLLSLFGLLGLSNLQRGVYIVSFALVVGGLAVWLSGTSIIRARRGGTLRPRASVTALVIGGLGLVISAILLIGFAVFGKQVTAYSQCLSGANTITAQNACQSQFVHSIEGRR
ncbi:MAG TPA: hypothetical protein VG253_03215 [Streptosporangiaceae bacterium]|jgi:hypothetical protein|nr:hypothetical protein [Streptosporangiaceae bacterium]